MRLLRSVRFNISLGLLIVLAASVGTVLPQIPDAPEKVNAFMAAHPQWSRLFDLLGLFNLYQSRWFMGLLGLMAFDIVACKLWRTPPDQGLVALPPEYAREEQIERHLAQKEAALRLKPYQASLSCARESAGARRRVREFLAREGYHLQAEVSSSSGAAAFAATRHRLQRWGSTMAHIALVVILLGALLKGVYGFVEMVPVVEGRSRPMQNKPDWEVYVDKFTVKYYDGSFEPKSFSSVLRVQKGETVLGAKTIRVNDPLDIGGVRFYQASWGAGGMFRSATLAVGGHQLMLPQRTPTRIPGSTIEVEADVLMPDFGIRADGTPGTESLELKDPAVRFLFHFGPHRTSPIWLLKNEPRLCLVEAADGTLSRAPEPPFRLAGVDPVLFSGIQVAYDPGYRVVLAGSLLWLAGMVSLFYLHRRRVWVHVEPAGSGARVSVGGWSSRGGREYEKEFGRLMAGLSGALGAGADFTVTRNPLAEVAP